MVNFADMDRLAASYQQRGGQPGLAYGIVLDGELVHAAGLGQRHLGGPAAGRRDRLPDRLDDQELHRVRDPRVA